MRCRLLSTALVCSEPVGFVASLLGRTLVFPVQVGRPRVSFSLVVLCSVVVLIRKTYGLLIVICPSDSVLVNVLVLRVLAFVLVHHVVQPVVDVSVDYSPIVRVSVSAV